MWLDFSSRLRGTAVTLQHGRIWCVGQVLALICSVLWKHLISCMIYRPIGLSLKGGDSLGSTDHLCCSANTSVMKKIMILRVLGNYSQYTPSAQCKFKYNLSLGYLDPIK